MGYAPRFLFMLLCRSRPSAFTALLLLLLIQTPLVAQAQIIQGRIVSLATGEPIVGAVIHVITPTNEILASVLSGQSGAFRVGGHYGRAFRLRVEMIGHRTWSSGDIELAAADSAVVDVRLETLAIPLEEIRAEASNLCARYTSLPRVTQNLLE